MSLVTPEKKMSKSAGEKHWIGINESPEIIEQKIAKAVTTPEGIENLKVLYDAFKKSMTGEFDTDKMAQTKKVVSQGIANHFADFRARRQELASQPERVAQILADGAKRATSIANATMIEVKRIIGIN
jgi:tryptophanyl-tRNA synthetase